MNNKSFVNLSWAVFGVALLAGCGDSGGGGGGGDTTTLQPDVQVTGSVAAGEMDYYSIELPNADTALYVTLEAVTGEVDCLVNPGEKPTAEMYEADEVFDYDWSVAGVFDAWCMGGGQAGTWYVAAWGNTVDATTDNPGGDYTMIATLIDYSAYMKSGQETNQALRQVAKRYLKHKTATASSETYPESGIVDIQKGDDHYRFYFGTDAVTPAVLSIDHNGEWTHFDSWADFEASLSSN